MDSDKSKTILPVEYPPITTFQGYAVPLAIQMCYPITYDWIYSNYINVYAFERPLRKKNEATVIGSFFGDYDYRKLSHYTSGYSIILRSTYPFLQITEMADDLLKEMKVDIIDFCRTVLTGKRYIYTVANTECIDAYKFYQGIHDVMVYGFDDYKKKLYIADFLSSSGAFEFSECSYDEFENAYYSVPSEKLQTGNNIVGLLRFIDRNKDYNCKYQLDYKYITDCICNYLNPDVQLEKGYDGYFYIMYEQPVKTYSGNDVYKYFDDFINTELNFGKKYIDYRLFHALYDHKEMMLKRMMYLLENGYIKENKYGKIEEYRHVRDMALIIRNMVLKFNITGKESDIDKIKMLLKETKTTESELLTKVFIE